LKRADEKEAKKFHDLVVDIAEGAQQYITEKLGSAEIFPTQKWIIHGRVVSVLFNLHFQLSMKAAEKSAEQAMENLTEATTHSESEGE
jgi:hypothetical protein